MQEIQTNTGARVKISQNNEFFPTTQDRVVLIQGELEAVEAAAGEVIRRVTDAIVAKDESEAAMGGRKNFKVLIPAAAAGGVIGRAGATIKQIGEQSGCRVTLAPKDQQAPGHNERVMNISGDSLTALLSAVSLVVRQMMTDPATAKYTQLNLNYSSTYAAATAAPSFPTAAFPGFAGFPAAGGAHHAGAGAGGVHHQVAAPHVPAVAGTETAMTTMTIPVNEAYVGYIIGKAGSVVQEIMRMSGATITISQKGEYVEGTTDRMLTVTGPPGAVFTAQHIITQKVQAAAQTLQMRANKDM